MDILNIIVNSKWQTEQVGYHYTRLDPVGANGIGRIYEMKDSSGWPADVIQHDTNWVYFFVTEDDAPNRADPSCYKAQTGVSGKGMIMLPRQLGVLPWILPHRRMKMDHPRRRAGEERRAVGWSSNPDTQYSHVVKCGAPQVKDLGTGLVSFDGPFTLFWGGQLGTCPTYVMTHEYSNGQAKERFLYALRPDGTSYGWVGWDCWALTGGVYELTQTSYRNTLVEVKPPVLPNPCKY